MSSEKKASHRSLSALIHPTWACNLHCLYCYSGKSDNFGKMSIETLRNSIYRLANHNKEYRHTKLIWHGGEATLMGMSFFEVAIQIQKEFEQDHKFINLLQTNCTNLDEKFMNFLIENNFKVGSSVDGPQRIHDSQRVNKLGKGTFERVMKTVKYFRSHGSSVNTLAVMTANTLENLDEFYEYIKTQSEYSVKVNPLISKGYACGNGHLEISPKQYGDAMIYLFDKWINEPESNFNIEPLAEMLQALTSGSVRTCVFDGNCSESFIGIDYLGNITPCGKWAESEYCFGNINQDSIEHALQSVQAEQFRAKREIAIELCGNCKYKNICNGGCPHNAYIKHKDITQKDFYCETYRIIFEHIEKVLKEEIAYASKICNSNLC